MAATAEGEGAGAEEGRNFTAIVLGGSGASGRHLIAQLLRHPRCRLVRSIARRSVQPIVSPLLTESERAELLEGPRFEDLTLEDLNTASEDNFRFAPGEGAAEALAAADVVFCGLGTTLANAGSKERFVQIDHDLLLTLARQAKAAGVPDFSYISASGADANSMIFYSRTKGQNEADLAALAFPRLSIFRPALLLTPREESRPGERFAQAVFPAIEWMFPKKYKSIHTYDVAHSMIATFLTQLADTPSQPTVTIYENDQMHRINGN